MSSTAPSPVPPPLPPNGSRWQFSLRTMLTTTTVLAVFLGFATILPRAFSQTILGLLWIGATGVLVTGLFFARDDQRAFCIGAAIVVSSTWTRIGGRFLQGISDIFSLLVSVGSLPDGLVLWLDHLVIAALAIANGWLCIQARRYFDRHAEDV